MVYVICRLQPFHSSREDVCMCGQRCIVDAQQLTPAQHHKPSGAVMCDEPSATSEPPGKPHVSAIILSRLCRLGTRPGHLPGFRGFHEDPRFQNSVQLHHVSITVSSHIWSCSRLSCHWCCRDSTTETRPSLVYLVVS